MSSTILMAIVLIVMWLVVLVPMFVRRHDDRLESRSMDRFQTAMRVLSRRTPGSGGVAVRRRYGTPPPGRYAGGGPPVGSAARAQMLSRRRRTLAVLATTALLAVPAALLITSWMWLLQVPTLLLLVGYLGWLRQQVRHEEERRTRRSALFGERPYRAAAAGTRGASRTRSTRPTRRTAAAATDPAVDSSQADGDPSWRPVPVPTPTYVTAPVARRRRESLVELDDEDLWFADVDLLGDAVDRPRAVNE